MKKMLTLLLIGMITLAPALVAAQTGSGAGSPGAGSSTGSGTGSTGGSGSTGATGSGSMPSSGSSSGSSTAPSASPSGSSPSLSTITNQADCEKAGGDWQASSNLCKAKN
jgi:hypothetical protein